MTLLSTSVTRKGCRMLGIKGLSKATAEIRARTLSVHRVSATAWSLCSSDRDDDRQRCRFPTKSGCCLASPTSSARSSLLLSTAAAFCSSARFSADIKTPARTAAAASRRIWCVPARDEHAHDVARLMEAFVSNEPQLVAASVSDALLADTNFRQRLLAWTTSLLRRGLSVVALEGEAAREDDDDDDGGVVIAALLNFVMHRDTEEAARDDEAATAFSVCLKHPAAVPVEVGISRVEAKADVFRRYGVDTVLAVGYGTVSPHRCGGGVLSRLVSAAEALAVRRVLQAAVCAASSAFSQSSLRRLGYEELASAEFAGLLDPTLFDLSKLGPHRRLVVVGKRLSADRIQRS